LIRDVTDASFQSTRFHLHFHSALSKKDVDRRYRGEGEEGLAAKSNWVTTQINTIDGRHFETSWSKGVDFGATRGRSFMLKTIAGSFSSLLFYSV